MRENEITLEEFEERVRFKLKFLEFAPIMTVSAKSRIRVDKILPKVKQVFMREVI